MKLADLTTLVVVLGVLVLTGMDKMDMETLLALLGGILLRNPLASRSDEESAVD